MHSMVPRLLKRGVDRDSIVIIGSDKVMYLP